MRLSEIVSRDFLTNNSIFDSSLDIDSKHFLDLEKLMNKNIFEQHGLQTNEIVAHFTSVITEQAARSPEFPEIKGYRLGFSTNVTSERGHGPSSGAVLNLIGIAANNLEYSSLIMPRVSEFGPDGLSDLMIFVFDRFLRLESNRLINLLRENNQIDEEYVYEEFGDLMIMVNGNKTRLLNNKILSNLETLKAYESKLKSANSRIIKKIQETQNYTLDADEQFVRALMSQTISSQLITKMKTLKALSPIRAPWKIARSIFSRIIGRTDDCEEWILSVIRKASETARDQLAKNSDPSSVQEESYHHIIEAFLIAQNIRYSFEAFASTGRVEFIIDQCDRRFIIEVKRGNPSQAQYSEWENQLIRYAESPRMSGYDPINILLSYLSTDSYSNVDSFTKNPGVDHHLILGQATAPSSGTTSRAIKEF